MNGLLQFIRKFHSFQEKWANCLEECVMRLAAVALVILALVTAAGAYQPAYSGFCQAFPAICDEL